MDSVAVIGSGDVGVTLANGFLKHGYKVTLASRDPSKLSDWLTNASSFENASTGTFEEAAKKCDMIMLAVGGHAAESALELCGADNIKGKLVMDATNPIGGPPMEGVLTFFAGAKDSLMEKLQAKFPEANFVKVFNSVGLELMVNPPFPSNNKPTMFICGNNQDAKEMVKGILDKFGWEAADFGGVYSARSIEVLCQLWLIPVIAMGRKRNFAFKLVTLDDEETE